MSSSIPLSRLLPSKSNPRKTKPDREAHQRLLSSIVAHGLIHPLIVRPVGGKNGTFIVIAGNRRLAALKEIHRGKPDAKVSCIIRKVDVVMADALSLGENFAREPMHPLDEAEAFARLARHDGKDALCIAAEFGVSDRYVRQRMKLADLAKPIRDAYRANAIDAATAEAFASVPEPQQVSIWKELGTRPQDAHHVKSLIDHAWISSRNALFDVSMLPPECVSADLFGEDVLVEREVFLKAQRDAVELRRQALLEEGWALAEVGDRDQVRDRLWSMDQPKPEPDPALQKQLVALTRKQKQLEKRVRRMKPGNRQREALVRRIQALDGEARALANDAEPRFSDQTKAKSTVFLVLDPDGSVHQEYRVPRPPDESAGNGSATDKPLTSEDLSDGQIANALTHQAMAVREALLNEPHLRSVVLVMALHEKVRSDGLAIRHDANSSTLHATHDTEFGSQTKERLAKKRAELDPLVSEPFASDIEAFEKLSDLSDAQLQELTAMLSVELLTNLPLRPSELLLRLAAELKVKLREHWTPDVGWFKRYRKVQLMDLLASFNGAMSTPAPGTKHSVLVNRLADLFAGAANGSLADRKLSERVTRWCPAKLTSESGSKSRR